MRRCRRYLLISFFRLCFSVGVPFICALSFLGIFTRLVAAAVKTVVIDDTYGDAVTGAMPVYSPDGVWTQGRPCLPGGCLVNPNPELVGNGTWHDSVGASHDAPPRTIELSFEGNSISVFCIISEVDRREIAVSNMSFELDGVEGPPFFHDVSEMDAFGNYEITYNFSVYSDAFAQGKHTLRINSLGYSRMLFDYALYTTDSDLPSNATSSAPPSSSATSNSRPSSQGDSVQSRPKAAIIAGAAVGGVVVLIAAGGVAYLLIVRRHRNRHPRVHQMDNLGKEDMDDTDIDARSYVSSDSAGLESPPPRAPTPFFPSAAVDADSHARVRSQLAHYDHDAEHGRGSESARGGGGGGGGGGGHERGVIATAAAEKDWKGASPSERTPLMAPHGDGGSGSRVVVDAAGGETRLVGPDNSLARFARLEVAEREAALTQRMRAMEAAIAARYGHGHAGDGPAGEVGDGTGGGVTVRTAGSGSSERALRGQVEELRAEIGRMRIVQQQMALELSYRDPDTMEPPPQYE